MEENRKPRPAFILLNRGEKIAGWIYLPFYLILISLMVAFVFLFLGRDLTEPKNLLYVNLIYGVINIAVVTICFRKYLGKSFRQARNFPGRFFAAVGIGFVIYWIGNYVVTILIQIIQPGLENINDNALGGIAEHGMRLMVLYTVLLVPTVEELMFRGLIFSSIRPRSRFWAYAVSMLVFAVMHVLNYLSSYPIGTLALCFLQYLPAGFALAWALEYSGSIWASICIHTINNAAAMLFMALLK